MNTHGTVLVIGATGLQGGSVARHLLRKGTWRVRCLSRHPDSAAAAMLRGAGAEVVAGDLDQPDTLLAALQGVRAVFGVTNHWEHFDNEQRQGKNLIDAVARAGVDHFVLSTLPNASLISGGALPVPHFDIKAGLEDYCRAQPVPATFVHVAYYFENFLHYFAPKANEHGVYVFGFPQGDAPMAALCVEDLGGVLARILEEPAAFIGRTLPVIGDYLTGAGYAAAMSAALGVPVEYSHIPREVFAAFGFPGAGDLANMFEFNRRYLPYGSDGMMECRRLYPPMQSFETWLSSHAPALRAAMGLP